MVSVELAVVVAAVVVLAVVAIWGLRRRGGDDVHSVEGYRHTLDTLQGIRSKTPTSVRVVAGREESEGRHAAPPEPPAPAGDGPVVFDDAVRGHSSAANPGRDLVRGERRAISRMNHRPRRVAAPVASALIVAAVVAGLIVVGARQRHHPPTTPTTAAHGSHTASTAATTGTHATGTTAGHHRAPPPTTTTLPVRFTPQSSTATTALYVAPSADYTVNVNATTGSCWVEVTSVATGTVLYTATLTPGEQQSVKASGTTTVLMGAPGAVAVSIDQTPVAFPLGYATPFTMTIQAPTTTTTTSGGATVTSSSG